MRIITGAARYHHDHRSHRTRSRRLPTPAEAPQSGSARCAEHRPDDPGRLLSQLPRRLVSRSRLRTRNRYVEGPSARSNLRHAVRAMEGEIPEGSHAGTTGGVRGGTETQRMTPDRQCCKFCGDGIAIRPWQRSDVDALYEAARESISTVGRWLPWCHENYTRADSEAWIGHCITTWNAGEQYAFAIVRSEERRVGKECRCGGATYE